MIHERARPACIRVSGGGAQGFVPAPGSAAAILCQRRLRGRRWQGRAQLLRPGEEKAATAILGGPGGREEEEEEKEEGGGRAWLRLLEELAAARPGEPALVTNGLSKRRGRGFGKHWRVLGRRRARLTLGRAVMTRTQRSLERRGGRSWGGADISHPGPAQSLGLQNLTLGSDPQNLLLETQASIPSQ